MCELEAGGEQCKKIWGYLWWGGEGICGDDVEERCCASNLLGAAYLADGKP